MGMKEELKKEWIGKEEMARINWGRGFGKYGKGIPWGGMKLWPGVSTSTLTKHFITGEPKWPDPGPCILGANVCGMFYTRDENPKIPYSAKEVGDEALTAANAGATIIHFDIRDPKNPALCVSDVDAYREAITPVKEKHKEILISGDAIFGDTVEKCTEALELFDVVPIYTAAINFGGGSLMISKDFVQGLTRLVQDLGKKPQIAIFSEGDLTNAERWLIRPGILEKPYYFLILAGIPGGATFRGLPEMMSYFYSLQLRLRENFRDNYQEDCVIMVGSAGRIGHHIGAASVVFGDHVRVGLGDTPTKNPWSDTLVRDNAEEVNGMKNLIDGVGRRVATPSEARRIIGLK